MRFIELLKKLFLEEIIIDSVDASDEKGVLALVEKVNISNRRSLKISKTVFTIVPLLIIILFHIFFYIKFSDRMNGMNFFSYLFVYSIHFYRILGYYFFYLIVLEFIYTIRYYHVFNRIYDYSINRRLGCTFLFLVLEIICVFFQYVLVDYYKNYLMIIPILLSILVIYLFIRYIIVKFSEAYHDLEGLV